MKGLLMNCGFSVFIGDIFIAKLFRVKSMWDITWILKPTNLISCTVVMTCIKSTNICRFKLS